LADIKGVKVLG